ncbi:NPCBM/NEW2 domain-containing protein [Candidatus Gottesmanbacteria bacterium]|nr:NPCBM/NEW2 domain-containing protein [Candidatus Gottesmanbacteria bacterium]
MTKRHWLWVGFIVAIILRLALIPNPGFEADVSFWKAWGLAVVDKGIIEGLKVSNSNYPTPFMYTLGAMVWIYKLFADPHNFNEFWNNSNLLFLTISKALPILADFGIAGIILWITRTKSQILNPKQSQNSNDQISKRRTVLNFWFRIWDLFRIWNLEFRISPIGGVLALLYLLSPISLIDGAWWGQVDSVGVFILLAAVVAVLKRWPLLAGVLYMVGVMTKLQNMIYGPMFFLFVWQSLGYHGLVRAVAGSLLAFFGLNIEFFLSRNMARVMASLTENYDYFPLMSLNAYNLWWIVSGAKGMTMSDKFLAVGIMNAKTVGLVLFSSVYLFAVLRQVFIRGGLAFLQDHLLRNFLESLILVNAAFFLFQTQSHDRYAFPLSVFLLLWALFFVQESGLTHVRHHETPLSGAWRSHTYMGLLRRRLLAMTIELKFIILYSLFTVFYFYNLHTALIINYPHNGIPGLSLLTQPFFTITTSVVLLVLFGVFLAYLIPQTKRIVFVVAVATLITLLFSANLPLILKKPVSLTKLTPYVSEQGYGKRSINMPVNSFFGYPKQSYLSVQYAFYREGIGTHSPSFMNYDLAGHFKKFTTDYGIDTQAGGKGSAVFEVYGDDTLLWRSEKIGRYDNPRHTEVNVTGVRKLGLITTDGGDGKDDDHVDWLNPKLWP